MERQPSLLDADRNDVLDGFTLVAIPVAAERLCVSRSKLYELIASGELPTVRIGRARRIAVRDLQAFVARRRAFR
jgi:excisionase family DNA binding protein